jgi:hypothetical protein
MTPLYLRRQGHWPDTTAPPALTSGDTETEGVTIALDLRRILELV